tara:strand:+ start:206 stop:937 length:732 start_codon:yes stop_codon:yes gene_type:complete
MKITRRQLRRIVETFAATAEEEAEKVNAQTGISLVTDQAFWEEMGVSTGEELAKSLLSSTYSDYYKDLHGIRPRWMADKIKSMSVEEIQTLIDDLDKEAETMAADEKWEEENLPGWEDEMIAAVKAHPEDVPKEYLEYETLPQQTGMGRRTEGIMRITRRQLRRIIRETTDYERHQEVHWKEGDLVRKIDYYGTGYGEDYKKTVGDQVGQVIEIDEDPDGTQYTVLFADGSTMMDVWDEFEIA